jgi:aminopeptidase-like protein
MTAAPALPTRPIASRADTGLAMHQFVAELYPLCRSITGDGVRQTLARIGQRIPLQIHEVATGTKVFDWTVPKEWNIRDAWIANSRGERVVDFRKSNLHVLGYSLPVRGRFRLEELKEHLFTDPRHPDWIPFRYSYYTENWGFCLPYRQFLELEEDEYEVVIDSSLKEGSLTYGECYLPGSTCDEVLISVHVCHPSMCNDNLSGIAVATFLAEHLSNADNRLSYRFVFVPTTIGSITWLALNEDNVDRIKHGFVLACVGDEGGFTYRRTRRGDAAIDRAIAHALKFCGEPNIVEDFSAFGFDERQYCSPGFDLPVGCLMRTAHGEFPQYHTSGDNVDFVRPEKLKGTLSLCLDTIHILERDGCYLNLQPKCEPQMGRRGIYRKIGGPTLEQDLLSLFWVLNFSTGENSLLDIAERGRIPFARVRHAADLLTETGLLAAVPA